MTVDYLTECAGCVRYDMNGKFIERFGCEEHLFEPGICPWEEKRRSEAKARKK